MATLTETFYSISTADTPLAGFVFRNITIPRGRVVNSAVWRVWMPDPAENVINVSLAFQATDQTGSFGVNPTNIADRQLTNAKIVWPQTVTPAAYFNSPNLAASLQEVINRPGWTSGNNVALIVTARTAQTGRVSTWNQTPTGSHASFLLIEYDDTVAKSGAIIPTGRLARRAVLGATGRMSGAVIPRGQVSFQNRLLFSGGIGPVGGVTKSGTRKMSGAIIPRGGLTRTATGAVDFDGGIAPTGEVTILSNTVAFGGGIAPTGDAMGPPPNADTEGSIAPEGALSLESVALSFGGGIEPTGELVRGSIDRTFEGSIQPTGELVVRAGTQTFRRRVRQGETITLQALYRDGDGDPFDPTDPRITIIDRNDVVVLTSTDLRTVITGLLEFDFTVPDAAPVGIWQARWDGTIDGEPLVHGPVTEEFVVELGPPPPPPPPPGFRSIVPAYFYPFIAGSPWDTLAAAPADYVIANAGDPGGPGPAPNSDYERVLPLARAAGATILGYVDTSYTAVPIETVEQQINDWLAFYPGEIGGFFIDQVSSGAGDVAYFEAVAALVRAATSGPLVFNPGVWPLVRDYADLSDLLVVFEGNRTTYLASYSEPAWASVFERDRFGHIVYLVGDADFAATDAVVASRFVGWAYLTSGDLPNPYGILPSYWNEEA